MVSSEAKNTSSRFGKCLQGGDFFPHLPLYKVVQLCPPFTTALFPVPSYTKNQNNAHSALCRSYEESQKALQIAQRNLSYSQL